MSAMRTCRGCGAEIPENAPFGHCPNCLLALGFGPGPDEAGSSSPPAAGSGHTFGDYELLEQIGRGGMGVIYKARQVTLNRLVALKMINAGELATPTMIQRFHLEAEAAANLHHPNIVPIYETGEHQGQHFFSMELVESVGLDRHITRGGFSGEQKSGLAKASARVRQEQMARIIAKVARAVDYAHQHGVLHRDIKPSNVLLDSRGEPRLTDFGVAKVVGHTGSGLTASGAIMGTPSYMAPEQAAGQGKRVTTAADIYSLGAILYALLTGHPPFHAETPVQTLKQVVEDEPKHPTTFDEGIDRDLATICMKCLEKEPQRRYPTAAALADDLERWSRKEPIFARPAGPFGRLHRWCRREPILASLGTAVVLCLAAATLAASIAYRKAAAAESAERRRREETERNQKSLLEVARRQFEQEMARLDIFFTNSPESRVVIPSYQLALLTARAWESNGLSIRFGIYTHTEPTRMLRRFAPLIAYVETNQTEAGVRIDLAIYKGYSNLVDALVSNQVDVVRMGPASYVLARQRNPSLVPLVHQLHDGQPIIDGLIFTRADSGLNSLEDLHGKRFAFADPDSTFGNYVSKAALVDAGIRGRNLRWEHLRTHPEVARKVRDREYDAGAANSNEVWSVFNNSRTEVRILHSMHSVSYPWVITTNLPPHAAEAIKKQLLALTDPSILTNIDADLTGFAPTKAQDYDSFEPLLIRERAFSEP